MRVSVKKWGNSAAVRIPAAVLETAQLHFDQEVDIRAEEHRIVIEPLRENTYKLEDLVAGITSENVHEAVDFGLPEGKEAW